MVSNREIRQLFDTIKQLGDIVKRQNAKLDSLSVELKNACKEVTEVKTELQTVRRGKFLKKLWCCVGGRV